MWLLDDFAVDFRYMRLMIYGYDSQLENSQSFQNIDDLARTFIALLKTTGATQISSRPIVLLAHSLGGILVKRVLTYLAGSGEDEHYLLSRIRLVLFFGVPHRGMHIDHLRTIVHAQPNHHLINLLAIKSPFLTGLDETFTGIVIQRSIRIVSVYETVQSAVAEVGKIRRDGSQLTRSDRHNRPVDWSVQAHLRSLLAIHQQFILCRKVLTTLSQLIEIIPI
jgi:hypothetical protein